MNAENVLAAADRIRAAAMERAARGELLTCEDMAAIFRMSRKNFWRQLERGAFDRFRVIPSIGRPRFSGVLVDRYVKGETLFVPTFGAKRSRR